MLKLLVKITSGMVTAGGFFGFCALAISLYVWIVNDTSQWLPVIGSAVFLVFLGGIAVLFRISEQLEEASQYDTKMFNAITMLGVTYTEKEKGKEGIEPFMRYVLTGTLNDEK